MQKISAIGETEKMSKSGEQEPNRMRCHGDMTSVGERRDVDEEGTVICWHYI